MKYIIMQFTKKDIRNYADTGGREQNKVGDFCKANFFKPCSN